MPPERDEESNQKKRSDHFTKFLKTGISQIAFFDYTVTGTQCLREGCFTMNRRLFALLIGFGIAAVFLVSAGRVEATLGEVEASVVSDEKALVAKRVSKTVRNGYTVQELRSVSVVVREYIAPSGVVFAVAWNGLIHPDLKQLLGSYAVEYETALRHAPREPGRRRRQVETNRVVVEKWGHMRNLRGRAYVPALIPSGVSVDEIK